MPKYMFKCEDGHIREQFLTYEEFDASGGTHTCYFTKSKARKPAVSSYCMKPSHVTFEGLTDGIPVATFYGSDFTRRSTDSRQNMRIDHSDKRSTQSYPGKPGKKADRSWH